MARKTGSVNHTHKYFKRPDGLWACAGLDDCTHFMPKNMSPAPAGRMSVCKCGKKFQLTPYNMADDNIMDGYPVCDACSEQLRIINEMNEEQGAFEPLTGLAAFGARANPIEKIKTMESFTPKMSVVQTDDEDRPEVIDDEGGHTSECAIYDGEDCSCKT
jgi:hypothetical protein